MATDTMEQQVAADVMTPEVISVLAGTTIAEAAERMRDNDVGDVMVIEDGRLVGMLTDRDLVVRVLAAELDPLLIRAGQVCTEDLYAVAPTTPVEQVVQMMRERAIRRVPVVDEDGTPIGAISIGDLAAARQPNSPLASISVAPPNR